MPLTAGTRLGAYEIIALLGAGGMGEVYRARDTRLDRIVAIKVLPSDVASTRELRERFERESRTVVATPHMLFEGRFEPWFEELRRTAAN